VRTGRGTTVIVVALEGVVTLDVGVLGEFIAWKPQ